MSPISPAMTTTSFPLLDLPSVAMNEFLKLSDPQEQLKFSWLSKKTENIVKAFAKRRSISYFFELFLHANESVMYFDGAKNSNDAIRLKLEEVEALYLSKVQLKFNNIIAPVDFSFDNEGMYTVTIYWKDRSEAIKNILIYFMDVFNPEVAMYLRTQDNRFATEVLSVLQTAKLAFLNFNCAGSNDDLYQAALDLPCKKLALETGPSSNFRYQSSEDPLRIDNLYIRFAHWVDLEYFLSCKQVTLCSTTLNTHDFNRFLKKWLESDSQLEYAAVAMNCSNFVSIVEGIPATSLSTANIGYGSLHDFDDGKCFEIQTNNGEKAIVYQMGSYVHLKLDSCHFF